MAIHDWHFDGLVALEDYPGKHFPQFYCNKCAMAFIELSESDPSNFRMPPLPDPAAGGDCNPDPKWHYWQFKGLSTNKNEPGRYFEWFTCEKCGRVILAPVDLVEHNPNMVDFPSVNDGGECTS